MTLNYKKIVSIILVFVVAMLTGFAVGKMYLDSMKGAEGSSMTFAELSEDESVVKNLYQQSQSKNIEDFSAMQLWQIAEYSLSLEDYFKKEMTGDVNSAGQNLLIKSIREKKNGSLSYTKLSPSVKAMGLIDTPEICTQMVYNYKNKNTTLYSGAFTSKGPTAADLEATFTTPVSTYTADDYFARFKAMPYQMVVPYIISSKTCSAENFSEMINNGDGTYTFEITLKGHTVLRDAALYYTEEICFSAGYASPSVEWDNVTITVTVGDDFKFKTISYKEYYTLFSPDPAMVIGSSAVVDTFVETFIYEEVA